MVYGQLKRDYFNQYKDPLEIRLMREVKQLFDPRGIMNPGKIFRRVFRVAASCIGPFAIVCIEFDVTQDDARYDL